MGMQFGYNCTHYLPTLRKCRRLIDAYGSRPELSKERWMGTADAMVYLGVAGKDLVGLAKAAGVRVRRTKEGRLTFAIRSAWDYDDCLLANSGGQCVYFAPHAGETISCIADLTGISSDHPNMDLIPSETEVRSVESEILQQLGHE